MDWKGKEDGRPSSGEKGLQTSVPMPSGGGKAPSSGWKGQGDSRPDTAEKKLRKR